MMKLADKLPLTDLTRVNSLRGTLVLPERYQIFANVLSYFHASFGAIFCPPLMSTAVPDRTWSISIRKLIKGAQSAVPYQGYIHTETTLKEAKGQKTHY